MRFFIFDLVRTAARPRTQLFLLILCVFSTVLILHYASLRYGHANSRRRNWKSPWHIPGESYKNGEFCVYPNLTQSYMDASSSVMMTLHSSADYIGDNLVEQAEHWKAPISLALFASREDTNGFAANVFNTHQKILTLIEESEVLAEYLTLTVFTKSYDGQCPDIEMDFQNSRPIKDRLPSFNETIKYGGYPINVARNIARLYAPKSDYILLADMDQIYSDRAAKTLHEYAKTRNIKDNKELLVVRRFEFDKSGNPPKDIDEFKPRRGISVFLFHHLFYGSAHHIPGLDEWMWRGDYSRSVEEVTFGTTSQYWEPMFVASADIPMHNEALHYKAKNHLALVWNLCMERYKFMVVDGVFNSHRGIKRVDPEADKIPRESRAQAYLFRLQLRRRDPELAKKCSI